MDDHIQMRVINFKSHKFVVGKRVMVKTPYQSGNITLNIGDVGLITGVSFETLLQFNLINIRVLDIDFGKHKISVGEGIAETYFQPYK